MSKVRRTIVLIVSACEQECKISSVDRFIHLRLSLSRFRLLIIICTFFEVSLYSAHGWSREMSLNCITQKQELG